MSGATSAESPIAGKVQFFFTQGLTSPRAALWSAVAYWALFLPAITLFWLRRFKEPIRSRCPELVLLQVAFGSIHYILDSFAYSEPYLGTSLACQLIFWPGIGTVPLVYIPYVIRGLLLYSKYVRGELMMIDNQAIKGQTITTSLRFVGLHRTVSRLLWWIADLRWAMLIIVSVYVVAFFTNVGLYLGNTSDYSTVWCNTNGFGYLIVALIILDILLTAMALLLVWTTEDVFHIRNELLVLFLLCGPLVILYVLSVLSVIPVLDIAFIYPVYWLSLVISLALPLIESYIHERRVHDHYVKSAGLILENLKLSRMPNQSDIESGTTTTENGSAAGETEEQIHTSRPPRKATSQLFNSTNALTTPPSPTFKKASSLLFTPNASTQPAPVGPSSSPRAPNMHTNKAVMSLSDILQDPIESVRFQRLAVLCFCVELVLFCVDVENFRRKFNHKKVSVVDISSAAVNIVDLYILEGSPREINIVDYTRREILTSPIIQKGNSAMHIQSGMTLEGQSAHETIHTLKTLFNQAELEAKTLLENNVLPRWHQ